MAFAVTLTITPQGCRALLVTEAAPAEDRPTLAHRHIERVIEAARRGTVLAPVALTSFLLEDYAGPGDDPLRDVLLGWTDNGDGDPTREVCRVAARRELRSLTIVSNEDLPVLQMTSQGFRPGFQRPAAA